MCKFPFDINLPIEIIRQIYIILIREKSINIIFHHYNIINKKTYALQNIISDMIYFETLYNHMPNNTIYFHFDFLENLNIILNNEFSREIYPYEFWQHLLHLISNRLMTINNRFLLGGNDKRTNLKYKEFLTILNSWVNLCKKHNICLKISKYVNFQKTNISTSVVYARNMLSIKNFNKLSFAPCVVINRIEQDEIITDDAINILTYYLF
tara:strand:- start:617 stop:1246 length:630 start_codon:yes stop_codon:yes gene_type:complete